MKNTATILVFVQDYKLNPYIEANVQIRDLDAKEWQTVSYDKNSQRFALRDLKPGRYELRVRGEKEWAEDVRTVTLHVGNNSIFSTLALEGAPYYMGADQEKVYFQPDESKILLYAQGKDLHNILPKLIKKAGLKLGEGRLHETRTIA